MVDLKENRPEDWVNFDEFVSLSKQDMERDVRFVELKEKFYPTFSDFPKIPSDFSGVVVGRFHRPSDFVQLIKAVYGTDSYGPRRDTWARFQAMSTSEVLRADKEGNLKETLEKYNSYNRYSNVKQTLYYRENYEREYYTIFRIEKGKLHCNYGPALSFAERDKCSYQDLDRNEIPTPVSETERETPKIERENHYFLNGFKVTQKAWKEAVKSGVANIVDEGGNSSTNTKAVTQTSRIKFSGELSVGEELTVYGDNDKIIWIRNGEELWALDRVSRTKPKNSLDITKKMRSMGISEDDKTRFFLVSQTELENIFCETLEPLVKSTTATKNSRW